MKTSKMIYAFTDKFPFVGPAFWIVSVQYYIIQIIVASAWSPAYSWRYNTISDLGNTICGEYSGRNVCSPLHNLMNFSFLFLGLTMIAGSVLVYQEFKKSEGSAIGFAAMAVAGIGTILVGLFPENTISWLHQLGAFLPFFIGNIGLLIMALTLDMPKSLRIYTWISGVVSLVGLTLFTMQNYLGLGIGGMERVTAYPQTMWIVVFGIYISSNHISKMQRK